MIDIKTIAHCADAIQGIIAQGPGDARFTGISIDTRTLQTGELYLALIGEFLDGHDYIAEAVSAGAAGVIVDRPLGGDIGIPVIQVNDTQAALIQLGRVTRQQFTGPVIAITGSCGKTTVKEICGQIFKQAGNVLCPQRSFNNHIGLPLTLCQLTREHDYAVLELGTNHPGEIAMLTEIAEPTIALVNNVGPAHLAGLATVETVAKEKGAIYQGMTEQGVAIINLDDAFAQDFLKACDALPVLTYSLHRAADVMAKNIRMTSEVCAIFDLVTPQGECQVTLSLPGEHQIYNALAAIGCALAGGLTLAHCQEGLANCRAVPGRWQTHEGYQGVVLIDDTYNANPKSVAAALDCLCQYPGQRWFVLGDMAELGDGATALHADMGAKASTLGIDRFYSLGTLSKAASDAFGEQAQHFTDKEALLQSLKQDISKEVTLVIKGSRSSKMETIIEALKLPLQGV